MSKNYVYILTENVNFYSLGDFKNVFYTLDDARQYAYLMYKNKDIKRDFDLSSHSYMITPEVWEAQFIYHRTDNTPITIYSFISRVEVL